MSGLSEEVLEAIVDLSEPVLDTDADIHLSAESAEEILSELLKWFRQEQGANAQQIKGVLYEEAKECMYSDDPKRILFGCVGMLALKKAIKVRGSKEVGEVLEGLVEGFQLQPSGVTYGAQYVKAYAKVISMLLNCEEGEAGVRGLEMAKVGWDSSRKNGLLNSLGLTSEQAAKYMNWGFAVGTDHKRIVNVGEYLTGKKVRELYEQWKQGAWPEVSIPFQN